MWHDSGTGTVGFFYLDRQVRCLGCGLLRRAQTTLDPSGFVSAERSAMEGF